MTSSKLKPRPNTCTYHSVLPLTSSVTSAFYIAGHLTGKKDNLPLYYIKTTFLFGKQALGGQGWLGGVLCSAVQSVDEVQNQKYRFSEAMCFFFPA